MKSLYILRRRPPSGSGHRSAPDDRSAAGIHAAARVQSAAHAQIEGLEPRRLFSALTIAQENQLPGVPRAVWDVQGAGDPAIQGFADGLSVNAGSTVNFKIDDKTRAPYGLDIYRMGYYGGDGARHIATLPPPLTQNIAQPAPLTDAKTGLVDCGNWSVTAHWDVPADATSGIYFAKVIRGDNGGSSHIVFVVRNDAGHAQVLFQTSDETWQAYNTYGGASLYRGNGPGVDSAPGRAYAVSYNRPFDNRGTPGNQGVTDWVFYAEYPMVRFMERNGYDVSYQTGLDTGRKSDAPLLEQHKVFMSVGHDEYWAGRQRKNVLQARDAGVNLAFMSGNECFWKTRFAPALPGGLNGVSPDAAAGPNVAGGPTPSRTMVCYKESLADGKIDPGPQWTGMWRDTRFTADASVQPENAMTGTLPMVNRGPNNVGTSMTVPWYQGKFRLWRNTSAADLPVGASATIGSAVLGYEWDADVNNGFRPANEIDLSTTTQKVSQLILDFGETVAPGFATHLLTEYRTPGGALVFAAGTVQWDWGLDSSHDGTTVRGAVPPVDPVMQQATINLLGDMGAQPATLMAGMVPATASDDHAPPASKITAPPGNTVMTRNGLATVTGTSIDSGGGNVASVEVSVDGGKSWRQAFGRETWSYTWLPPAFGPVTVLVRATDDSLNTETPGPGIVVNVTPGRRSRVMFSNASIAVAQVRLTSPVSTNPLLDNATDASVLNDKSDAPLG